jgi:UDP-glucose 6-dehydrogenase
MEFAQTFKDYDIQNDLLESTLDINEKQKESIFNKIEELLPNLE